MSFLWLVLADFEACIFYVFVLYYMVAKLGGA